MSVENEEGRIFLNRRRRARKSYKKLL